MASKSTRAALEMAQTVLGQTEGKDRASLMDYMKTGGVNIDPQTRAWCAAFVNASLQKAGYSGTGSDLAKSFTEWGNAVEPDQLQPGDVAVYNRGSDPKYGHAGLVESYDPKTGMVSLISGNAGKEGAVTREQHKVTEAIAYRRAAQMAQEGYSPEQIQKAFLDTIAGPESGGAYDVMYGGNKFTDYSKHPGVYTDITSGPNKGKKSSAAGRYQFLESTWNDIAGRHMLKDFSPENQDKAAWELAEETYAQKTGGKGNLIDALQSGDPARVNAAADMLKGVWTSMPGGIETQGYGGKTFADVYNQNLGANPTTGGMVTGSTSAPPAATPEAAKPAEPYKAPESGWSKFMSGLGKGLGEMDPMATNMAPAATPPASAGAPGLAATAGVTYDEEAKALKRQKLAEVMARLNSGSAGMPKLWG